MRAPVQILLAGNPNVGKTQLFNRLTGSFGHVGNWQGVTTDAAHKEITYLGREYAVYDLPGTFSLKAYTPEEAAAVRMLDTNALVVNVVDVNHLARNLYLTLQLIEKGYRVLIALTMTDELRRSGQTADVALLSKRLGVPVHTVENRSKAEAKRLLSRLAEGIPQASAKPLPYARRLFMSDSASSVKADAALRYSFLDEILTNVVRPAAGAVRGHDVHRLSLPDKIALNRLLAVPLFLLIMGAVFYLTFGMPGSLLADWTGRLLRLICKPIGLTLAADDAPVWLRALIEDGILGGLTEVFQFLPQVLIMFGCLAVLEETGYLSRAAFMSEGLFNTVGLSGRSVFTFVMGLGCSATAVLSARAIKEKRMQQKTVLFTPYVPCSAKLPVFVVLAGAFFGNGHAAVVFLLYLGGLVCMFLLALLFEKLVPRLSSGAAPPVLEMPAYRLPTAGHMLKGQLESTKSFLIRIGTVVLGLNILMFVLANFSFSDGYVPGGENSLLFFAAGWLAPVFRPLGFGDWRAVAALLCGLAAKESVISVLNGLGGAAAAFTGNAPGLSAASFLVFTLLYSPCIATVASSVRVSGAKWAAFGFFLSLVVAYLAALLTRVIGLMWLLFPGWTIGAVVVLAALCLVRHAATRRRKRCAGGCGGDCGACVR